MSKTPDAWDDDWSTVADSTSTPPPEASSEIKKVSAKVSKAQKRAQQAEFNRQLWDQAEKPQETNYFLESRNIVPLRSEFKPPPILLSRKGPVIASRKPPTDSLGNLTLKDESSEDEDETKPLTLAERQAKAAKEREEKQRKYEERRQELFGPASAGRPKNGSGNSSPVSLTPPGSRSATPNRNRGRGGRRGGASTQPHQKAQRELFDPSYNPRPDSTYLQRRENGNSRSSDADVQPIRVPKGPDGSGRGGFGFVPRGGKPPSAGHDSSIAAEIT